MDGRGELTIGMGCVADAPSDRSYRVLIDTVKSDTVYDLEGLLVN